MRRALIRKYKRFKKWAIPELKRRFSSTQEIPYKDTPIVINNFNRIDTLLILIKGLETRGYNNIYIIDNDSTYPPLLEYYKKCPYPVYMLNKNIGHLSIWETGIYKQFTDSYFAYTDSDLEIHPDCPDDFIEKFILLLKKYPKALKVGFSICINDLPDSYSLKKQVQDWENQYWQIEIEPNVFKAPIDTTFAVYKPYFKGEFIDIQQLYLRTGFPYSVRHLPWYVDNNNLTEEEQYYVSHLKTITHWSEQNRKEKETLM